MTGNRTFAIIVAAVVLVTIGLGLYLAGSPAEARLRRLDDRRVDALRTASYSVDDYWKQHSTLPVSIDSIPFLQANDRSAFRDPETGRAYRYLPSTDSSYQLCADFARQSEGTPDATPYSTNWYHPAGSHCFSLQAASRR